MSPRVRQWIWSSNRVLGCNRDMKPCASVLSGACSHALMRICFISSDVEIFIYNMFFMHGTCPPCSSVHWSVCGCVFIIIYIDTSPDLHGWRIDFKTTEVGNLPRANFPSVFLSFSCYHSHSFSSCVDLFECENSLINHHICCEIIFPP